MRFLAADEGRNLLDHLASPSGAPDRRYVAPKLVIGGCIMLMLALGFAVLEYHAQSQYGKMAAISSLLSFAAR